MSTSKKLRILAELRPANMGFAGIPQETRLVFSSLLDVAEIDVIGLINSANRLLQPGYDLSRAKKYSNFEKTNIHSRVIVSMKEERRSKILSFIHHKVGIPMEDSILLLMSILRIRHKIYGFDAEYFDDFIWNEFFSSSLSLEHYSKIADAAYRTLSPSWEAMQRVGRFIFGHPLYPSVDTRGFDIFLTQMPFPGLISPGTRMVVRYHDGISVFQPHTIPQAINRLEHIKPLRLSAPHATYVCTSAASRADLLTLCPEVEARSYVIHNMVADSYFEESASETSLLELIPKHIDSATSPKFRNLTEQERFFSELRGPNGFKYILMVSTLEPRKNHVRLIEAWEMLRAKHGHDVKLVLVGSLGWQTHRIVNMMRSWLERGEILHLSGVPAPSLRLLYNGARCVVCPSIAEGFDQSGIEAMLCGGVTVASDIPVHQEVYGDAAAYFHPYSVEDQTNAIRSVISDDSESVARRDWLRLRGLEHAKRYRQNNVTPKWHAFFEELAGRK